jgi:outer membrane receptor protein involved in Fe transport
MSTYRHVCAFGLRALAFTLFTTSALAQIETVVVTAQRRAEDVQTVPISITAITAQDLKAKQIDTFRDLQFHVPSLTFSKQQFGGAIVYIRGVNSAQGIGGGVAVTENDIFLEDPPLNTGIYFDLERVETLRGPQPTNYGRGSNGGALNIHTNVPDLDHFGAQVSYDYGSFNTMRPEGMINIPIVDGVFGIRFAATADFHDGYEKNLYNELGFPAVFPGKVDNRINSNGTEAFRFSTRWDVDSDTTLDMMAEASFKNDSTVQGDKALCHRDPSGVLGCLPDRLGFDPVNNYATFSGLLSSKQSLGAGGFEALNDLTIQNGPGSGLSNGLPGALGQLGIVIPHDLLTVVTPYNPKYIEHTFVYTTNFVTKLTDWLGVTVDGGYENLYIRQYQGFETENPENLAPQIEAAVSAFNGTAPFLGPAHPGPVPPAGSPCFFPPFSCTGNATPYDNAYFGTPGIPNPGAAGIVPARSNTPLYGLLPVSNNHYAGGDMASYAGIIAANPAGGTLAGPKSPILTFSPYNLFYNSDNFSLRELTAEVRFQTNFSGPFNFTTGAFFMGANFRNQYWIDGTTEDYGAIVLGELLGNSLSGVNGLVGSMPQLDAEFQNFSVMSQSGFFEGTYDIIPDELKFIAGTRYTNDRTREQAPLNLGYVGQGTTCVLPPGATPGGFVCAVAAAPIGTQTIPVRYFPEPLTQLTVINNEPPRNRVATWQFTGRAVLQWMPKLDFTNATLVYAQVSRGFGYSGFNASNISLPPGTPVIYKSPEVLSMEVGTKNTLADNTLQANLDVWYYNYQNYSAGGANSATAFVQPVPARLYGLEGELIYQPDEAWQFNASLDLDRSEVGNYFLADPRNLAAGVSSGILIKDLATGSNCLVQRTTAAAPATPASAGVPGFFTPGGGAAQDTPYGIPYANFGTCTASPANQSALQLKGFTYSPQIDPNTGVPTTTFNGAGVASSRGVAGASLHGNSLPNIPFAQLSVGVQYTNQLDNGYSIVPRIDYYWQSHVEISIYNDPNIDRIGSWDEFNAQIQLNAPSGWYAKVFATNVFDKRNPTGAYIAPAGNGLFTNLFLEDPRVIGVSVGATW